MRRISFFLLLIISVFAQGQKLKKEDRQIIANLEHHIQYLADDKLEGRRTGTQGEKLAADYISNDFKMTGLQPKGTDEFFQRFEINEGKQIDPATYFKIDSKTLELDRDFFPLALSPNKTIEASSSIALQEPGTPWFYNLKELLEENKDNPHFDANEAIADKAKDIKKKGATALIIYNTSGIQDEISFDGKDRSDILSIPVLYIRKEAAKKYLNDESATLDIKLKIELKEKKRTGTNVIGYIDNGAPVTVILGAHYDHLGHGEDGNARSMERTDQVYNGADDN